MTNQKYQASSKCDMRQYLFMQGVIFDPMHVRMTISVTSKKWTLTENEK